MNHKDGYKKRYKMYKSGKFWVVAGLFFLGSIVISDVHVSAQESEITTAKAATEVMEIGDPVTEEATFAEESVVNEIIGNEAGPSKEQASVLTLEEQVDTVQETVTSTQVEEEQKNEMNESAEASETEDFVLTVNPIKDTDTVVTGVANKNTLVSIVDEQGNILGEGYTDGEGNFSITVVNLKTKELVRVNSNYTGSSSLDVTVEVIEENDKQVTPRMLKNEPVQALENTSESTSFEEAKEHSSITTTPRKNDNAYDTTPGVINLAVYQIQNLSGGAHSGNLVISFDPSTGKTYGMRYRNGVIDNRKELTSSYQQFGFGPEAVVRLVNGGTAYEISTNNNGNRLNKQRDYSTLDPNKSTTSGWFGIYRNQSLPQKKSVTINFLDNETKNSIIDSEIYTFYEGYHYDITLKDYEKIGDYDYINTVGELSYYLYGKDNKIDLFYKKTFDKDAHKP
ncbi:KxYKxGKxW signal peptide domain-containing protein, partial [Vagococcus fluvialis]|uniref:KxYKxGKxW signal peptide domain-containing protein n=1 Tax=Vagococcus fluvialis TaxID=2738 RepID=UPI001A8F3B94